MSYQKIKGTIDYFGLQTKKRRYVEDILRDICLKYNMEEVILPTIENTEVFVRSSGEGSDVVTKEMYTFLDKGNRSITLRPEGTAGVVRSFLENKLYVNPGLKKYFYTGPMFRYERPQAGRYREFNQFGVEFFAVDSYLLDACVIALGYEILKKLGFSDDNFILHVNTIGNMESRTNYTKALVDYFTPVIDNLCPDCKNRLEKNPMRILDCKVDKDNEILIKAPKIKDYLTDESKEYFNGLLKTLDNLGIKYVVDDNLVRGLDYYTDTVFEFISQGNDALSGLAIIAGGKYADLVRTFGGPDTPGIGFGIGLERIIGLLDSFNLYPSDIDKQVDYVVIGLDPDTKVYTFKVAKMLRDLGKVIELDYANTSFKAQFKVVDRVNPKYILIFGEEEVKNNVVTIKDNKTGEQKTVKFDEFMESIKKGE
ncbi:MAG: histidine--tRNA ligase [Bacilli bacterium]|nr:histidine--tRNA ligase [Bacilli bacterium]